MKQNIGCAANGNPQDNALGLHPVAPSLQLAVFLTSLPVANDVHYVMI